MARPLRVLFVDDSVYDCMLLVKELRHGGFEPRYARVDTPEALAAALGREPWEIVFANYNMAQLGAAVVLKTVREHDADLPVIVVSESAGDESAVAAMTAGAKDFLLRDKLDRLLPAVERELGEVANRRARARTQHEARRTDELLRLLAEASSEIITVVSPDGAIRFGSPSIERTLGYRPDELNGANATGFIHADDHAAFRRLLDDVARGAGATHSAELRFRHKDGSWRTLDCLGKNLLEHPAVSGIVLDARDVTDRRQTPAVPTGADTVEGAAAETSTGPPRPVSSSEAPERLATRPVEQSLGRYRVLQMIGEGGMGTVYKAHDPKLDRVVAIKVPRFDVPRANLSVVVQRFLREARSAAQVRHPNVCPIYDVDEQGGVPFVVMAFVDGESLADRLRGRPQFADAAEAVRLIRLVAVGLKAVHAHGIVHRDLKPANILLDRDDQPLLTDFGLARPEHDAQRLTMHGAVIGTPGFMAPEQAASDADRIGPWTDLYSIGVVLYSMLTGRLPYQGSALTMLMKQLDEPPLPPSTVRPDLDPQLEAIVLKAMARRPEDRYQTAQQFIDALDAWLATGSNRASPTRTFQEGAFLGDI